MPSTVTSKMKPKRWGFALVSSLIGLTILVLGFVFFSLKNLTPDIKQIPFVPNGKNLVIHGQHFGSSIGQVRLASQSAASLDVLNWTDSEITAHLPAGIQGGTVQVVRPFLFGEIPSPTRDFIVQAPGLPSQPFGYQVPVEDDSPWPTFRRDQRNTGSSPVIATYHNDKPWIFQTGKGIFNTPVIDNKGIIYIGSADHFFYAINPDGTLNWKYETGEIIDSAAAIGRFDPQKGIVPITFISGDGFMYHFRTGDGFMNASDRLIWKYEAELRPGISFNRWFEGNVAIGQDGTLYAGNTNFNYYAIHPDGTLKWVYGTTSNNWSQAAFGDDGAIYWGSVDTYIRSVSPSGSELWKNRTLGFVAASAAIGSDGTVYMGSFDSNFYAFSPQSGQVMWTYPTNDHIYSSAAIEEDANGQTKAIYFASADGNVYALRPDGSLIWRYDTGDAVRSSPALGRSSDDKEILYIGSGNGYLYAINPLDGSLRWRYNTTPSDPELADRNDLNGSPALGQTGIYIGGEHGQLIYVPYDYCLKMATDPQCDTGSNNHQPDGLTMAYITPGGNTHYSFPNELDPSALITLKLSLRQKGQTQSAFVCNSPIGCPDEALKVTIEPNLVFDLQHSADGKYIYIRPLDFLKPGTAYQLTIQGKYYTGGFRFGNMTLGGNESGKFKQQFSFKASAPIQTAFPLKVDDKQNTAFEWTRLAAPLPPMMPSLNQIGFDYMEWIIGTVKVTPPDAAGKGKILLWAIGGQKDSRKGLVVDPKSDFILPLSGTYQDNAFIITNQNFVMPITGIPIPFNLFELRARMGNNLIVQPGASAYGDTDTLSIPKFGPYLVIAGLANNWYQRMLVSGTFITRPYPAEGTANQRPSGITVSKIDYLAGQNGKDASVTAHFNLEKPGIYPIGQHIASILLTDTDLGTPVNLDYKANLSSLADTNGDLSAVTLNLPASVKLPKQVSAYILLDVYPIRQQTIAK